MYKTNFGTYTLHVLQLISLLAASDRREISHIPNSLLTDATMPLLSSDLRTDMRWLDSGDFEIS